jgi:hypothetical protein
LYFCASKTSNLSTSSPKPRAEKVDSAVFHALCQQIHLLRPAQSLLQALLQALLLLLQALLQALLPPRVSFLWPRSPWHGCEGMRGRMSRRRRGSGSAASNKACYKACGVSLLLVGVMLLLLLHNTSHTCIRNACPPCIYATSCMQHTSSILAV